MIWSIFPQEMIFDMGNEVESKVIEYKGIQLLVDAKDLPPGRFRVLQLLSTEPQHFLRSDIAPGAIIDLINP